ncbi:MAG: hypothetical protein KDE24_28760, partial [Caldilinea sp.]|nr:hypothetical protein [Caldilinea sp.]
MNRSPCHPFIFSSCHLVILSSCHPVILSSCHPLIPSCFQNKDTTMPKITFIGAGSFGFTRTLVRDLLT